MAQRIGEDKWSEPEPLPDIINEKNAICPQILFDGKTLVFASDQRGGKGGYDLFKTVLIDGSWSKPQNMDYINTPNDEKYFDMSMVGSVAVLRKDNNSSRYKVMKVRIPNTEQSPPILIVKINIAEPTRSRLILYSYAEKKELINEITEEAKFTFALPKTESMV